MKYGILSDIHSNWEALEAVLEVLDREGVGRILCTGDVVGYGADPVRCLETLEARHTVMVAGNHDWAVAGKLDLDWFNERARTALEWTKTHLPEETRVRLGELPLVWQDETVTLVHGSLHEPETFPYIFDLQDAQRSLSLQKTQVAFVGHTHVPAAYALEKGQVTRGRARWGHLMNAQRALINVGSVGQPRDGDPRASFCVYDADQGTFEIRRVVYPVETTQAKIRKAGLPDSLARRLERGS